MIASLKRPRIALADLSTVSFSSFNHILATFQGCISLTTHTSDTFSLNLISDYPKRAMVYIEVKGEIGTRLSELNVNERDKLRLVCKGARRERLEDGKKDLLRCRVTYENNEIEGWIKRRGEEGEEYFSLGLPSKSESVVVEKIDLLAQLSNPIPASHLPLNDLPSTQSKSVTGTSSPSALAALDLNSPTSNAKKRKPETSTNDNDGSPSPVPSPSKRVARTVTIVSASTAPPSVVHQNKNIPRIETSKTSSTQASRFPPPTFKTLTAPRATSFSTSSARTQTSTAVKSEWDLVSASGHIYSSLKRVKDKKLSRSGSFAVMIVKTGKLTPPRGNKGENDPYCARFFVTDPSLDSSNLDSYASTVELQWYEKDLEKLPPFQPGDVLFLRKISITPASKLRRYNTSHVPYISLTSSSLLSPSNQPSIDTLVFKDSFQLKLSQPEIDHAFKLAAFYRGKLLDEGKDGEGIAYQLKRLEGQMKPRELEFEKAK